MGVIVEGGPVQFPFLRYGDEGAGRVHGHVLLLLLIMLLMLLLLLFLGYRLTFGRIHFVQVEIRVLSGGQIDGPLEAMLVVGMQRRLR